MTEMKTYWRGRPLDQLSKEELIEAVEFLGGQVRCLLSARAIDERVASKIALMKQGRDRHVDA